MLDDACAAVTGGKQTTAERQMETIKAKRATASLCVVKELTVTSKQWT